MALLAATPTFGASILLGERTMSSAGDLTAIQTEGGEVWEWLDLSLTRGLTVDDAQALYVGQGFRWATGTDVAQLYSAFGITYGITAGVRRDLSAPADAMERFVDYFGYTQKDDPFLRTSSSLGWIDDLTSATSYTYSCLSVSGGCSPFSFVTNVSSPSFWPQDRRIGVYMVRDVTASQSVAEPGTLILLGVGVAAAIARRQTADLASTPRS
jgi:hypothetical protein